MNPRLGRSFFARDTLVVARELLGQRLVAAGVEGRTSGFIVEVEAYVGEGDRASHARSGPTQRNRAMYGPAGCAYVYFIYGMHYCLNIVTGEDGFPAAVLIRALEPVEGTQEMETRRGGKRGVELANGPAKLCQALAVGRQHDGVDMCAPNATLFVEWGRTLPEDSIVRGPRVGVRGDERACTVPWRLYVEGNRYVSRHRAGSSSSGGAHASW